MEIQCQFRNQNHRYSCVVEEAFITKPGTEIKAFIGDHLPGKSNGDVEDLCFTLTTLHYFPRRLDKFFPRLTSLLIYECGLKAISRENLSGLENLKNLIVINNELRLLPSDLFLGMRKLQRVSFADNKLEYLSSQMLVPLLDHKLQLFDLNGNTSINAAYNMMYSYLSIEQFTENMNKCKRPQDDDDNYTFVAKRERFKELFASGRYSDFTIVAGKENDLKKFKVHKSILGPQSTVFEAVFEVDMEEKKNGEMKIIDFTAEVVEEMLCFMYTGKMPTIVNAMDLLALAAKYDVGLLKIRCEEIISQNITQENALDVLHLGFLYIADDLKEAAFEEIKTMFPETQLDESLKDKPCMVKKLFEARSLMKKKVKQATNEYEKFLKMCKKQK